jgi:23S rRNA (cytidine2498-2'-O)-methyltransferase
MNPQALLKIFDSGANITGYLAAEGFESQLALDAPSPVANFGRLIFSRSEPVGMPWAQNVWFQPKIARIESIKAAARLLAGIQRNWWPYQHQFARRMELIQTQLPFVSAKEQEFPSTIPHANLGSWTMIDPEFIVYSAECSSKFPNGEVRFKENHTDPPSRAYLKLWEALSLAQRMPGPGDVCMDLGASPGGWAWALIKLGAKVIAVDRSPLHPALMSNPLVEFREGSAFACQPQQFDRIDWLFSDVICYPDRLYEFVTRWIKSGKCRNFVCTIKFQGAEHYHYARKFAEIPGSQVVHLSHNKHELTWMNLQN